MKIHIETDEGFDKVLDVVATAFAQGIEAFFRFRRESMIRPASSPAAGRLYRVANPPEGSLKERIAEEIRKSQSAFETSGRLDALLKLRTLLRSLGDEVPAEMKKFIDDLFVRLAPKVRADGTETKETV